MITQNEAIITAFYTAFAAGDAEAMVACYHDDIIFHDPAFGLLEGEDAKNMWRMLIRQGKGQINIQFSGVVAHERSGTANWIASYVFSKTKRKVVNRISASFEFKDGKISRHTDYFDFWKWSKQALGAPGLLFGWTQWLQQRVRKQCLQALQRFNAE